MENQIHDPMKAYRGGCEFYETQGDDDGPYVKFTSREAFAVWLAMNDSWPTIWYFERDLGVKFDELKGRYFTIINDRVYYFERKQYPIEHEKLVDERNAINQQSKSLDQVRCHDAILAGLRALPADDLNNRLTLLDILIQHGCEHSEPAIDNDEDFGRLTSLMDVIIFG